MICDDVRRVAYFYIDGKLGKNKDSDLSSHLSECPDCEARITVHRRIRSFLKRRLNAFCAPEHLRDKVRAIFKPSPSGDATS